MFFLAAYGEYKLGLWFYLPVFKANFSGITNPPSIDAFEYRPLSFAGTRL